MLAEAVQIGHAALRYSEPYEKLKALTRGQAVTKELLHEFIASLEIPTPRKHALALTRKTIRACSRPRRKSERSEFSQTAEQHHM